MWSGGEGDAGGRASALRISSMWTNARREGAPMADLGDCKKCGKPSNRTHICIACGDKFCTGCRVKAGSTGKCPTCGKAATIRPNSE